MDRAIKGTKGMEDVIKAEWKDQPKNWGHSFHQMCSYMAMFPARIPHYFLELFTKEGDVVLDPFCGRGTTPLQACAEGRLGIGMDLNPLAYHLTRPKLQAPSRQELLDRIAELRKKYEKSKGTFDANQVPDNIRMIFSERTLDQMLFLKKTLDKESRPDSFITGMVLGIIHGASRGYLSVPMPNTFSMSPNYIRKYIGEKNLAKPDRDVFGCLLRKAERLYRDGRPKVDGIALKGDVRDLAGAMASLGHAGRVKLIVTSPPYMKVIKYGLYNWIRLWFLDMPLKEVDEKLDDEHSLEPYLDFMLASIRQMQEVLCDGGVCVMVIGDVKKIKLAEEVWKAVESDSCIKLRKLAIVPDAIDRNKKVTRLWKEKRGEATNVDRLLVMYKGFVRPEKETVNWNISYASGSLGSFWGGKQIHGSAGQGPD